MSYSYASANPRAAHNPLRSRVWNRPAHEVIGWTAKQGAEFDLDRARQAVLGWEGRLQSNYKSLGFANKLTGKKAWARRAAQAKAFREINQTRGLLRDARRALAAAELAMLAFTTAA